MFLTGKHNILAYSPVDSLEIYDPYTQADDIRRILNNSFSVFGDENKSLINKYADQIDLAKKNNSLKDETDALIRSGDVYFRSGLYSSALVNYFNALKIFESINDSLQSAFTEIKIGRAYYFSDLIPETDYITKGYITLKKSNNLEYVAYASFVKGTIEKDPDIKAALFRKALDIQMELVNQKPDDYDINENLSRYFNANDRTEEALKIAEKIGNNWLIVLYLNNIGYAKVVEGKYDEAANIFFRSLRICINERYKTLLRNTYENIGRVYRLKGDWKKATYYNQLMHYVEGSLYLERYSLQSSELNVKYATEKKQLENDLLKKEKIILAKNVEFEKIQKFLLLITVIFISLITGYFFLSRKKIRSANVLLDKQHTEIKKQKETLENLNVDLTISEQNLKIAQATAHLANWEWDFNNDLLTFSDELPKIYGVDKANVKTNFRGVIIDKIHPDDREQFRNYFYENTEDFHNEVREYRIIKNDEIRWIKAKRIVVKNGTGEILRVFGTVQDITEIKKEEEVKIQIAAQQSFTKQLIESQEEERKRIAGELHDGLGQDILLIKNRAQLGLQNEKIDSSTREQLKEINNSTSGMLRLVREISFNLRPAHLERLGLTETIISLVQKISEISEINFSHNIMDIDNLFSNEMEINFYRIIQEGINNIIKHSGAKNAFIEVNKNGNNVFLNIIDDGNGFELKSGIEASGGFGLNNILNRIKILSGTLNINSVISEGTKLEIVIPIYKNE